MNELAMFHLEAGQWEEAVPWGEQALQLRKVKLGQDHPDTLTSMVNLATIYLEARQLERAQQLLEESLALQKNRLGNENPNTLICMGCLAMSYFQAGQLDTARSLGERTLELMKNQLGPDHPHTLISMNNLAMYYWYSSQPEKALPLFDTALQLHRATLGSAHPNTLQAVSNLVEFYKSQQDNAAALNRLQQVMESAEWQSLEKEARQRFQSDFLVSKAMCLNRLDRSEDAEAAAREALQLREATMPDTCKYFQAMSVLGESLAGQKHFNEAEPLLIAGARGILSKADEIPAIDRTRFLQRALQRVITLYEVRNQPDSARPWQDELERLETSSNSPSP
jgi:tetratricopeptide (TPR) repeat protein